MITVNNIIKTLENTLKDNPKVDDYDISKISYKKGDSSVMLEFNVPRDTNKIFAELGEIFSDFPNFDKEINKSESKND